LLLVAIDLLLELQRGLRVLVLELRGLLSGCLSISRFAGSMSAERRGRYPARYGCRAQSNRQSGCYWHVSSFW
jgi:hypothetical protein